ncbi:hypothetical protein [Paraburkholderia pallida]|uniref:Uncharacterized protein n=1 Tax=Paraburkholderia pallida TaxID=2547399 RepID=A0A4P7D140_9BURK|nr:hypothetical protein [Paraburkholderia pallida]QBR01538.1 hypothetical protein E1956_30630 [Paraburkholderia pallida]
MAIKFGDPSIHTVDDMVLQHWLWRRRDCNPGNGICLAQISFVRSRTYAAFLQDLTEDSGNDNNKVSKHLDKKAERDNGHAAYRPA